MKNKRVFGILLAVGCLLTAGIGGVAAEIKIFAAASLTDCLKDIALVYEKQSGDRLIFNFGASSTLARQIAEGAPADLFFSADEAKMDELEKQELIVKSTRKSRLSNSLVIVVNSVNGASIKSPNDLVDSKIKRIALGDPKAVPIGVYAREYLEQLGIWTNIVRKVVATENVRAALAAVEEGNADASIVYKTDTVISKKVKIAFEVPRNQGPKISYPVAAVKDSHALVSATKLLAFLDSDDAAKVFEKYGFVVIPPANNP